MNHLKEREREEEREREGMSAHHSKCYSDDKPGNTMNVPSDWVETISSPLSKRGMGMRINIGIRNED